MLSDDAIADLLAKHSAEQTEPPKAEPANPNAVLSDDAIADLLAKHSAEQAEPPKAETKPEPEQEPTKQQELVQVENDTANKTEKQLPPIPQPVVPILQTVRDQEQQLENEICSNLLSNLELEESNAMEIMETEKQSVNQDAITTLSDTTKNAPKDSSNFVPTAPKGSRAVTYINVIQELVEDEALYSSKMLNCDCPRCLADMKALTLTNLPSKYVVVEDSQKRGLMRIYSSKYSRTISVQMMKSCVIVNQNPHH